VCAARPADSACSIGAARRCEAPRPARGPARHPGCCRRPAHACGPAVVPGRPNGPIRPAEAAEPMASSLQAVARLGGDECRVGLGCPLTAARLGGQQHGRAALQALGPAGRERPDAQRGRAGRQRGQPVAGRAERQRCHALASLGGAAGRAVRAARRAPAAVSQALTSPALSATAGGACLAPAAMHPRAAARTALFGLDPMAG